MDFYGQWELELTWIVLKQSDQGWWLHCSVQQTTFLLQKLGFIFHYIVSNSLSLSQLCLSDWSEAGEKSSTYREEVRGEWKGKIIEKNGGPANSDKNDFPCISRLI